MKPNRYNILVIPDPDGETKRFSVSRTGFVFLIIFFLIILVLSSIYMVPKVMAYEKMKTQYDDLVEERTQVLELYRDLERLQQLSNMMQRSLGGHLLEGDSTATALDTLPTQSSFQISYIENIPSMMPVEGILTQKMVRHTGSWQKNHYGIDIAVAEGTPVLAAASGQVVFSGWTPDLGNLIVLYHGDDYFTYYGHNQLILVDRYQVIKRGYAIANAGDTGMSTGPHLHFEIWKDGEAVDPLQYFPQYLKINMSRENNG